jgi:hypothetical protein
VQHVDTVPHASPPYSTGQHTSPWRAATFVVGAVAVFELVALLVLAGIRLAPTHPGRAPASHATTAVRTHAGRAAAPARAHARRTAPHPLRPRGRVRVLVLNGNGIAGAAGAEAQRLTVAGYRVAGATNAPRHDYARSLVMYVPGWAREAHRLAHDAGVQAVAPLDGLRVSQLRGSKLVLLLGT